MLEPVEKNKPVEQADREKGSVALQTERRTTSRNMKYVLSICGASLILMVNYFGSCSLPTTAITQQEKSKLSYGNDNATMVPTLEDLVATYEENECGEGLVLVTDRWVQKQTSSNDFTSINDESNSQYNQRFIPKIIHVTAKSRCMTPEFASNLQTWKDQLPDYTFVVHNDDAIKRLLTIYANSEPKGHPLLKHALHCAPKAVSLTDIWRAVVLYEYGGIYTDIDNRIGPNFIIPSTNETMIKNSDEAFFVVEGGGFLSHYFMAVRPGHPILRLLVHYCVTRLLAVVDINRQYVAMITGPPALVSAFQAFMGMNVTVPPPSDFIGTREQTPAGHYISPIYRRPRQFPCNKETNDDENSVNDQGNNYTLPKDNFPNSTNLLLQKFCNVTVTIAGDRGHCDDIVHRQYIDRFRRGSPEIGMVHWSKNTVPNDYPPYSCIAKLTDVLHPNNNYNFLEEEY